MSDYVPQFGHWMHACMRRDFYVGVVGLGYVGLPLALEFSAAGFAVRGFDIDASKVRALNEGRSYIQRIGAGEIVQARAAGLRATTDFAEIAECQAVLLCVPTPLKNGHEPDMSFIENTAHALAPHLARASLLVLESTTWPGTTTELLVPLLESHGVRVLRDGDPDAAVDAMGNAPIDGVMIAFSPEREDPGNARIDRKTIPKVIGALDARAARAARALYETVFARTVMMSTPAAAEMTKLLENIFRGVNIALVNELKQLCLAMGIDIWEVIDAASTKPFGFMPFYPGPGIGGHCIPVDPFYLSWRARQFGQPTRFIELAGEVNEGMPAFVVETTRRALGRAGKPLAGASVLLLGVAYKRDVDDLRESPALVIFNLLSEAGARVAYNDPFFPEVGAGRKYALRLESTPLARVGEFDCALLVTDHSAYDVAALVEASQMFVDTRNATRGLQSGKIVRC